MRKLEELPIDLAVYDTVKRGGAAIGSLKSKLGATWRRSTRTPGGFWIGTCDYALAAPGQPTAAELLEMKNLFLYGLTRELRETLGGLITWQGFLTEMVLTVGGMQYIRRWTDLANRVKAIYTRLGDNLLTNGSVESGAWTSYGSPSTNAQSTTWISDGQYSDHIIAAHVNDGCTIQTGIAIVASKAYDLAVAVKIVSGTWKVEIYRTDTGASLASGSDNATGQRVLRCSIPDTALYAGNVGVRIYCTQAAGEIYADGAVFRQTALRAETSWAANTAAQTDYGTLEMALLLAGMSDAAANAHVQTLLGNQTWPRTLAPDQFGSGKGAPDGLQLTFDGYAFTLRNKYVIASRAGTTQNADVHVTNLVGDSEFITAGSIAANSMSYQIDDRAPLRAWEVLRNITLAGDTPGNRWTCGVYANRVFNYAQASTTPDYHYRGGQLYSVSGQVIDPWLAAPGLIYMDDMPAGPSTISANQADDPHVAFIEEVEFSAADWLAGGTGLSFRRLAGADAALGR